LYLFVHIPKTGGQTLRNHFIKHLVFHQEFIHLGPYGVQDAEKRGLKPFAARSEEERRRAFVILGHYVASETYKLVPGKEPHYVTFLRDPAERLISLYNFTMHYEHERKGVPKISFEAWYHHTPKLSMTQWICRHFLGKTQADLARVDTLELARATLDRFWFVGTLETFDEDVAYLLQDLGLPPVEGQSNVTGDHYERTMALSDRWREEMYQDYENDLRLHRLYRDRRRDALKTERPFP